MQIRTELTSVDGAVVVIPYRFEDARGAFSEIYRADQFASLGLPTSLVQLNHSWSKRNVIRGLHFQWDPPMGKLMRVVRGEAFLVAVDIRRGSPTVGRYVGLHAGADNGKQLYAPAWFARGFCALSDVVEVEYLCTGTYNAKAESGIRWDDPTIGIEWPTRSPVLSDKDRHAQTLAEWLARPEASTFVYA